MGTSVSPCRAGGVGGGGEGGRRGGAGLGGGAARARRLVPAVAFDVAAAAARLEASHGRSFQGFVAVNLMELGRGGHGIRGGGAGVPGAESRPRRRGVGGREGTRAGGGGGAEVKAREARAQRPSEGRNASHVEWGGGQVGAQGGGTAAGRRRAQ